MRGKIEKCESTGKICYTEREAGEAINSARKRHYNGRGAKRIPMREYFCDKCGCYHLTHIASCKTSRAKQNFEQKKRAFSDSEAEKKWREDSRDLASYRSNRW